MLGIFTPQSRIKSQLDYLSAGWLGQITLFSWCCSVAQSCPTLCDSMDCSMPPVLHHLPELTQPHVHRVGDAIQPSHPLLSSSPPAFNLSQFQGLFQWVSSSIRWPKCWGFNFSISLSNEYSGFISLGSTGLISLVPKGFSSLLQHHNSKASILRR